MGREKKDTLATFRLNSNLHNWFKDYAERQRTTMTHIFTETLLDLQQRDLAKRSLLAKHKLERLQRQGQGYHKSDDETLTPGEMQF
jgi:hypothetical protein